jgi:hypothetical protein
MATLSSFDGAFMGPSNADNNRQEWLLKEFFTVFTYAVFLVSFIHPAFHWILQLIPGHPPDSLNLRLISSISGLVILGLMFLFKELRRFIHIFNMIYLVVFLVTTHLLVVESQNHYLYLSACLLAIFGAGLVFPRVLELALTLLFSFVAAVWLTYESDPLNVIFISSFFFLRLYRHLHHELRAYPFTRKGVSSTHATF